jgi:hypothetical protein
MIDFDTLKRELDDGNDPDKDAELLRFILEYIRGHWDYPEDALTEIAYILNGVFPKANFVAPERKHTKRNNNWKRKLPL